MADPIDKLEVLLDLDLGPFEDKLEEAVDKVDRLDGKTTNDLEEDLDDTSEAADDLTESMQDADNQEVRPDVDDGEIDQLERRLRALDGRSVEIDADVDRERLRGALSGGGGGRDGSLFGGNRLPGELDEVQEGALALGALPPQLKALGAAATAAVAALGAGAGLAGVATKLALELGPQGLQSDVKAARATFKETGREFASAFSGVIRSEVLPAARGLATVIQSIDDELAVFSGAILDFLKSIPGAGTAVGAVVGVGRAQGGSRSNADALAQGTGSGQGGVPGIRQIISNLNDQIARVRGRFEQDLIPKEEMLKQIKSFRLDAFKQLQKLKQQVPGAFPPDLLDAFAAKLRKITKRLEEVRAVSLQGVATQPADAEQVETEGQAAGDLPSISGSVPDQIEGIPNATERIRRLRQSIKKSLGVALQFVRTITPALLQGLQSLTRGIGEQIGGALFADPRRIENLQNRRRNIQQNLRQAREAGNFGQVRQLSKELEKVNSKLEKTEGFFSRMGQAFRNFGNVAKQVLQQVISKLVSAATLAAALAFIPGLSSAGFGTVFKGVLSGGKIPGLASGGIVTDSTLAVIGEGQEDEAVLPLSKLESMMQPSQATNINLAAEARIEGSDLVIGVRNALNNEAAIGGPGRL